MKSFVCCAVCFLFCYCHVQVSVVAGASGQVDPEAIRSESPSMLRHVLNVPIGTDGRNGLRACGSFFVDVINSTLIGRCEID